MPPTISSWLGSSAPVSQLEAPIDVEQIHDFSSDRTAASIEGPDLPSSFHGIDWTRLRGFEHPPPKQKKNRVSRSFIWRYGWRLYKPNDDLEYWICRLCHISPRKPSNPSTFSYVCTKATSSAMNHLKERHQLGPQGVITKDRSQSTPSQGQSSLDAYCSGASERNRAAEAFDHEVFKGLLTRLFTIEQLPLQKVESPALRDLLMYCNPRCRTALPGRTTLRSYITSTYEHGLTAVELELSQARTKINLSFDLWTSPNRRLSLLGVVAHYLDSSYKPRAILLALPRMTGAHTAVNLSGQIRTLIRHFNLQTSFGYAITDNASENRACLDLLSQELAFDAAKRHVLCTGHIINLVAHKVLFGTDIESFEHELSNVTAEAVELASWRRKGPIGKLHNIIRYISHSSQRQDAFIRLQEAALESCDIDTQQPLHLIRDNVTRWNSWYDAAERAIKLRQYIDEFTDDELADYNSKVARYEARSKALTTPQNGPIKAPSLLEDKLTPDDWDVIVTYMTILKPCKQATMKLQGNVSSDNTNPGATKGAIWQVLPVFGDLMKGFEEARQRHLPVEAQIQNPTDRALSTAQSLPPPTRPTNTRRRQRVSDGKASARPLTIESGVTTLVTQLDGISALDDFAQSQIDASFNSLEHHFNHNINAAWQKLNDYYKRTDATPIYRAAVFLHPRLKWRWFERYWETKPAWIAAAREAIAELWSEYKTPANSNNSIAAELVDDDDEWSNDDHAIGTDQLWLYEQEPHSQISVKDSPINYWVSKQSIWPQLAQMALDVYSTTAMSDEPERVFSATGTLLAPRRRQMTGEGVEQMTCLRSWQQSGIITLSQGLFNSAVATAIDEDEEQGSFTSLE